MSISANISCGISCPISRPISKFSIGSSGLSDGGDSLLEEYGGASAAFSLRDLGGGGNVVRLRRGSDNAEKDFSAGEVVAGTAGSELVTNGGFDTDLSGWAAGTGWSRVYWNATIGYVAQIDGSQTGRSFLTQNGIYQDGNYIKVTFDIIACSDFTNAGVYVSPSSLSFFDARNITSPGTYSLIFDRINFTGTPNFRVFANPGVTLAIDNMSCKYYTPSAAELWVLENTPNQGSRLTAESAYATTWYDQAASNEQVFEDPTIQSPGDWTDSGPFIDISEGLISVENAFGGFFATYNGGDIQPGTYRLEVDYYGVTQANRIAVEGLLLPMGSGTKSETITVTSPNTLSVTSNGGLTGQTGYITGIRLIDLGNPATQTTSTAQPLLIRAGVTNVENGKAALSFDSSGSQELRLGSNPLSNMNNLLISTVYAHRQTPVSTQYVTAFEKSPNRIYVSADISSARRIAYIGTNPIEELGVGDLNVSRLSTLAVDATTAVGYYNGAKYSNKNDAAAVSDALTLTQPTIGSLGGSSYSDIDIQELIVYPSDQSANRIGIEANINNYYVIYYQPDWDLVGDDRSPEMAAGYSLRDLGGGGPVVRLRRASDNAEQDFTAADVEAGTAGAELVTNGGFATDSDWIKGTGWSITGGQAVCDGSQVSNSDLSQTGVADGSGQLLLVSFDIVATSDVNGLQVRVGDGNSTRSVNALGFGVGDTVRVLSPNVNTTCFLRCAAGVTATIDNVSVKQYTPSAAEEWAYTNDVVGNGYMSFVSTDSAYATTWYDQAASNEQVFEDPTIQDTGNWTDTEGEVSVSQGRIQLGPCVSPASESRYQQYIPSGRYRIEVDYENSVLVGPSGFLIQVENGVSDDGLVFVPAGSGTVITNFTITSAGRLKIRSGGGISGQSADITGVRIVDMGNPATQTTSTAQPLLIRAGVTATENGKAALEFDGTDDYFDTNLSVWDGTTDYGLFSVVGDDPVAGAYVTDGATQGDRVYFYRSSGNDAQLGVSATNIQGAAFGQADTNNLLTAIIPVSGTSTINSNGQQVVSGAVDPVRNNTRIKIGSRHSTTAHWNTSMQELVFYASDQSANRTGIEANINNYYGIYYQPDWDLADERSPEMAAGYSLRDLGGGGNVVRLRRASDNAEQDFTADELSGSVVGTQVILNPEFDSATGWSPTGGWSISGGQAVNSGTNGNLQQGGKITVGVTYIATIEISACSNFADARVRFGAATAYPLSDLGITSTGTHQIVFEATSTFFLLQTINSATMTVDFMGCEEYTPTGAEAWVIGGVSNTTQLFAYATAWYDQSASNEQIFPNPSISAADWSYAVGSMDYSINDGRLSMSNVTDYVQFNITYPALTGIEAGKTYRVEFDYENCTHVNGFALVLQLDGNVFTIAPSTGSGTASKDIVAAVSGDVNGWFQTNQTAVYANGGIDVTGVRVTEIGNPATQYASTAQPLLIRAGVTNVENGKAALEFDGTDDHLDLPNSWAGGDLSYFIVNDVDDDAADPEYVLGFEAVDSVWLLSSRSGGGSVVVKGLGSSYEVHVDGSKIGSTGSVIQDEHFTAAGLGQSLTSVVNGDATLSVSSPYDLGTYISSSFNFDGSCQELILYASDQSENRTAIETNINDFYRIT